jgi:uncharacterized protein YggE
MCKTLFLTTILLCPIVVMQAQVMGNYGVQQQTYNNVQFNAQYRGVPKAATLLEGNTIEITINALANHQADTYTAIFNVVQIGKTAEETNAVLNQRLTSFLGELKTLGLTDADLYVDMVNFLPKYEYDVSKKIFSKKTYTEIPRGFELQKNVHVRYREPALLEKIVTSAARQEIYDIVKVDYFIDNPRAIYGELRDAAFKYLTDIKAQYRQLGLRLDSSALLTAENAWVAYPINRYESYQAYSTQSLELGNKDAVINNADKPVSRFYNAVPANDYDIVINPNILEPAVQFSYNLVARFTLPERKPIVKTETKKEFVLVTPTGEVKSLKIE